MITINDKKSCCGCHSCYNMCPKNAIDMIEDEKGFKYPIIKKEKCINCGLCEKVCPILNKIKNNTEPEVWAMYNNNLDERIKSSSGGIFTLLAKEILNKNGVVFGAMYDDNFNVYHSYITNQKDIYKLQGSKYVQSDINNSYKLAKTFLEEGRYVLFTGTSCQIEGLNNYLIKEYDRLYTQDIICHGVPSPKVWRKYLDFQKENNKESIQGISFRNKDNGWSLFNTKIIFDTKIYSSEHGKDLYMKSFLKNTCLRDSCYSCKFKNKYRNSDITLADFWGANNVCPEMNDDKGLSLVLVNSKKGEELFNLIKDKCTYKKEKLDTVIKYNSAYDKSAIIDKKSDEFFNNIDKVEFDELVKKYVSSPSKINKIIRRIKNLIK